MRHIVTLSLALGCFVAAPVAAQDTESMRKELGEMRRQLESMKQQYEKHIETLEKRLQQIEQRPAPVAAAPATPVAVPPPRDGHRARLVRAERRDVVHAPEAPTARQETAAPGLSANPVIEPPF